MYAVGAPHLGGEAQVAVEAAYAARLREVVDLLHHLAARKCWPGRPERGPAGSEVARDGREAVEPFSAQPCKRADCAVGDDELTQLAVTVQADAAEQHNERLLSRQLASRAEAPEVFEHFGLHVGSTNSSSIDSRARARCALLLPRSRSRARCRLEVDELALRGRLRHWGCGRARRLALRGGLRHGRRRRGAG